MISAVVALSWAVLVVAGLWRLRTSGTRYVPSGRSIGAVGDRSLALNDRMAAVAHVHGDRESTTGAFGIDRRWPVWSGALRRWALLVSRLGGRGVTQPTLAYRSGLAGAAASLAAGARAGQSPTSSIRTLLTSEGDRLEPNLAADLASLLHGYDRGRPMTEVLRAWTAERPCAEVSLFAGAIALGSATGGRLADALDGVAATILIRLELAGEQRAMSSQAVLTAKVLVGAPVVFAFGAGILDERIAALLLTTPFGWSVVAISIALNVMAWRWMTSIVRGSE